MAFLTVPSFFLLVLFLFLWVLISGYRRRRPRSQLPPGPKGWPVIGNLLQLGPMPHMTLHEMSKLHGTLFSLRLGSVNTVVATSAEAAEKCLRGQDANFSNRPPNAGAEHIAYNYRDLVFAPYGARWRMLRRLCALHLFSSKALEDSRQVRAEEVQRLVRTLAGGGPRPVSVGAQLVECSTDVLARMLIGRPVYQGQDHHQLKDMIVELLALAGVFNIGDFVPALACLDLQGVVKKMKRLHIKFDKFLDEIISEHKEGAETNGRDMLSALISFAHQEPNAHHLHLTHTDIKALFLNLFVAGTDTQSSTVEWALSELIRRPDLQSQAQAELDSVIGRDRLVSESDLHNLPLLQAIVKETFRLHPSTPLSIPRICTEDCKINGYNVARGTNLLVNIWSIGRDPSVWREPLAFNPERFMKGGLQEGVDVKGGHFEFIPFGAGRRICAGLSLGLGMVQLLTATLVHAFEWHLPQGESPEKLDMKEEYSLTLHRAMPLIVEPTPRLSAQAYLP